MLLFIDRAQTSGVRKIADGYLVADVLCARTGIQVYQGSEVGKPELDVVRVFRPEAEVFAKDSLNTYAHRPVTDNHPAEPVNAKNWKRLSKGQTGGDVVRDGQFVRVQMMLMDAESIADYENNGAREISMGYSAEIVFGDGATPDGEKYDAYLKDIRINHLARVPAARGGERLRIGDWRAPDFDDQRDKPKDTTMTNEVKTQTVLVDGLSVLTTDAGAQAITLLQGKLKDADSAKAKLVSDHAAAIAAKDADLAKKDAEIDGLKGKQLSDAQIDDRVKARADLIATAKSIADADYTGKSDADIRKSAVVAKLGDAAVKDKPEAYIAARFDILADESAKDPVRKELGDRKTVTQGASDPAAARKQMIADMQSAHITK